MVCRDSSIINAICIIDDKRSARSIPAAVNRGATRQDRATTTLRIINSVLGATRATSRFDQIRQKELSAIISACLRLECYFVRTYLRIFVFILADVAVFGGAACGRRRGSCRDLEFRPGRLSFGWNCVGQQNSWNCEKNIRYWSLRRNIIRNFVVDLSPSVFPYCGKRCRSKRDY